MVDFNDTEARLHFFETILEQSGELTMVVDEAWNIVFASQVAEYVTGYAAHELVGLNSLALIHPDDLEIAMAGVIASESSDSTNGSFGIQGQPVHLRIVRADGSSALVAVGVSNLRKDPTIRGLALRAKLATSRWYVDRFLEALMSGADQDEVFRELAAAVSEDIPNCRVAIVCGWRGTGFTTTHGYKLPSPLDEKLPALAASWPLPTDRTGTVDVAATELPDDWQQAATEVGAERCWIQSVDDEVDQQRAAIVLWRWDDVAPMVNHELDLQRYARFVQLALYRWAHDDQLRWAAHSDQLTGLVNRAGFYDDLEAISQDPYANPVCVFFIDLDGFKEVNDTQGHAAGDAILQVFARRIAAAMRPSDVVARLGGDEFAVVAMGITEAVDAEAIAGRLVARLIEPVGIGSDTVRVGCSIGVSARADPDEPCEAVVQRADAAMYEAKRSGGNRFHLDVEKHLDAFIATSPRPEDPSEPNGQRRNVRRRSTPAMPPPPA